MLDRRQLLQSAALTAAAAALPVAAAAQAGAGGDPALRAVFDRISDQVLADSPQTATQLGLDKGARAGLRSQLDDRSDVAIARATALADTATRAMAAVPRDRLRGQDLTRYDTVQYALGLGRAARAFPFGYGPAPLGGGVAPYVVSQQNGAAGEVPEFLDTAHPIETRTDADAYIARLGQFDRALDQETARVREDAGRGVIAPDFVLDNVLGQLKGLRAAPTAEQKMVTSVARRTAAKGIAGDYTARATRIVEGQVYPALDRQIAALTELRAKADDRGGVWKLPDGEAYYALALRAGTTTSLSATQIHATGLAQSKDLHARMDVLLRAQGMTQGSVGERLSALTKDTRYIEPNTPEGRAKTIAYVQGRIDAVRPLLPKMSRLNLKADVTVKRVPEDIQDGAALGYMNFASLDGSRPAIYYINLKDNGNWPQWTLATLVGARG